MDEDKSFDNLLTSLRILGCVEPGDFIGTDNDKNLYCRYSNNWWNTLSDLVRFETWSCTHEALKKIYVFDLPHYIKYVVQLEEGKKYILDDVRRVCEDALVGMDRLKQTYNIAYQTKTAGKYDEIFDTLIDSYAKIHLKSIKNLLKEEKKLCDSTVENSLLDAGDESRNLESKLSEDED